MSGGRAWFLAGLFLTTLSTLTLEVLDTRLLSVLTWYHLSFFAVSTAMFGMAAGAVRVYLGESRFGGDAAPGALARCATWYALSIPASNLANLCIPIPPGMRLQTFVAIALAAAVLAVPFYLSGLVVSIALTRIRGPSGLVYAFDLLGAALGSAAILLLFEVAGVSSSALLLGAVAGVGAFCFHHFARTGGTWRQVVLALSLLVCAVLNDWAGSPVGVVYENGRYKHPNRIEYEFWTIHGRVVSEFPRQGVPFFWGRASSAPLPEPLPSVSKRRMAIDGLAGTWMTGWDGRDQSLAWTQYDVTSLPYHLRKGGDVAVVGVGGGRDLLTALWARSRSVTGIEINSAFLELLEGPLRSYAGIADDPRIRLVHDEGRSYLTRTSERFDVLQMSLIDTWAATGAGAFTLTENGLYTLEAWSTFLGTLKPRGLFSVSRWYAPTNASETSRLVALATAALLERGIAEPEKHLVLASADRVATLMVSPNPFSSRDLAALAGACDSHGFRLLLAPGEKAAVRLLGQLAKSRSIADIDALVADLPYDYTPPTDERPYFFNVLKPELRAIRDAARRQTGVISGNVIATITLGILWLVAFAGVVLVVIVPLVRSGLPSMDAVGFAQALLYFALIGTGFMLVQIPLMQRFSVYLGHPTYSVMVILFSMILAAGIGSYLSDRIDVESRGRWLHGMPLGIAANLLLWTLLLRPLIDSTIQLGLPLRIAVVVLVVGAASLPLGFCFPLGLRVVRRISDDATPWMWGINGATGVLASVSAVAISMWSSISTSLYVAVAAYALILFPVLGLWRRGSSPNEA